MAWQSDHLERLERLLMKAAAAIEANERSRALGSVSAALGVLTMLQVPANPTKQAYYNAYDAGHEGCVYAATYNGEDGAEQLGYSRTVDLANVYDTRDEAELVLANGYSPHLRQLGEVVAYDPWTMNGAPSCACDSGPLIDVEHDAGCRRCGFPVRWAVAAPRHEGAQP